MRGSTERKFVTHVRYEHLTLPEDIIRRFLLLSFPSSAKLRPVAKTTSDLSQLDTILSALVQSLKHGIVNVAVGVGGTRRTSGTRTIHQVTERHDTARSRCGLLPRWRSSRAMSLRRRSSAGIVRERGSAILCRRRSWRTSGIRLASVGVWRGQTSSMLVLVRAASSHIWSFVRVRVVAGTGWRCQREIVRGRTLWIMSFLLMLLLSLLSSRRCQRLSKGTEQGRARSNTARNGRYWDERSRSG